MLAAAGLDDDGGERRSDLMLVLWFATLIATSGVGGALAALADAAWPLIVVPGCGVLAFVGLASRQPPLPPQRRTVRVPWQRFRT